MFCTRINPCIPKVAGRVTTRRHVTHGLVETAGVLSTGVIVHEAGHLLAAKWRKISVDHVSIGIGPVLLAFSDNDDIPYLLRAIPFGGYVSLRDQSKDDTVSIDDASIVDKILVTVAGPVCNLVFTAFLSAMVSGTLGHVSLENGLVVDHVVAGTGASRAGMLEGDVIRSVNGMPVLPTRESYDRTMLEFATAPDVELDIVRGASIRHRVSLQPAFGRLGFNVTPNTSTTVLAPVSAVRRGIKDTMSMTKTVLIAILDMVRPWKESTGHPLVYIPDQGTWRDAVRTLQLINVNIAALMSFPVPPMDGFWVGVYVYEWLSNTKLDKKSVSVAGRIGSVILFTLFILSIVQDLLL